MRHKIILAVISIIYAAVAAVGIYLGQRKSRPQSSVQSCVSSIADSADTDNALVFVAGNGLWYHRGACREHHESRIPVKLSVARKYSRPCTKCRPQR